MERTIGGRLPSRASTQAMPLAAPLLPTARPPLSLGPAPALPAGGAAILGGVEPPRSPAVAQAAELLAALRSSAAGRLSFGGRLRGQADDPTAALRRYYPSLALAHALGRREAAVGPALEAFARSLRLPDDLQGLAVAAVDAPQAPDAPLGLAMPPGELGRERVNSKAEWRALLADLHAGKLGPGYERLALDDATVRRVFERWHGEGLPLGEHEVHGEAILPLLLILARGKELGVFWGDGWSLAKEGVETVRVDIDRVAIARRLQVAFRKPAEPEHGSPAFSGPVLIFAHGQYLFDEDDGRVPRTRAAWSPFLAAQPSGDPEIFAPPPVPPLGRRRMSPVDLQRALLEGRPEAFQVDDATLRAVCAGDKTPLDLAGQKADLDRAQVLGLLRMFERAVCLGLPLNVAPAVWFGRHAPAELRADVEMVRAVARAAARQRLNHPDYSWIVGTRFDFWHSGLPERDNGYHFFGADALLVGHHAGLWERRPQPMPARPGEPPPAESDAVARARARALVELLDALDPAHPLPPAEHAVLLKQLFDGAMPNRFELSEILETARERMAAGRIGRLDVRALAPREREPLVRSLVEWYQPGAIALLAGIFLQVDAGTVGRALREAQAGERFAEKTGLAAERLTRLSAGELAHALDDEWEHLRLVPTRAMTARGELLAEPPSPAVLAQVWRDLAPLPVGQAIRLMAETALVHRDPTAPAKTVDFFAGLVARNELLQEALQVSLPAETFARGRPEVQQVLEQVVAALSDGPAGADAAAERLLALARAHQRLIAPSSLAALALERAHAAETTRVLPLDRAEAELPRRQRAGSTELVGITLKLNANPDKDEDLIPTRAAAELVLTRTTRENLGKAAVLTAARLPFILEGAPGTAKTSIARHLAWATQSPFRRFLCTPETTAEDLIGRIVGGKAAAERTPAATLAAEPDGKLRARLSGFGLEVDPAWERERLIAEILDLEARARWIDGPLLRAMKHGEMLLLDEYDALPDSVVLRLNALADGGGVFVVQEHRGETIEVSPDFVLCAAQNGAFADRKKLERSNASRWTKVVMREYDEGDYLEILKARHGDDIPLRTRAALVKAHMALAELARAGDLERSTGGVSFGPRDLKKVADRFVAFRGAGVPDADLIRREAQEIYQDGLKDDDDQKAVQDILRLILPAARPDFYAGLELKEEAASWSIGDLTVPKMAGAHPAVPGNARPMALTPRLRPVLYKLAKALAMGENVLLVGGHGTGKTGIAVEYARRMNQPYLPLYGSEETDVGKIIGEYGESGWRKGALVRAVEAHGLLAIHEINAIDPLVTESMNSALDNERAFTVDQHEGERYRLPKDMGVVATMNDAELGFGGRSLLSKPLKNRFTIIRIPELVDRAEHLEIAQVIAQGLGVNPAVVPAIVDVHLHLLERQQRTGAEQELTVRQIEACLALVAKLAAQLPAAEAYLRAVRTVYASAGTREDEQAIMAKAEEIAR